MKVDYIQHCGSDLTVVNAARVSFDKESEIELKWDSSQGEYDEVLSDKDIKLIKYLASHQHTSPFNHSFLTVRVKAPIFVARQLVKHKFMPWNEISRRYVDSEPEFYEPDVWRKRADDKKQGSSDETIPLNTIEYQCGYEWGGVEDYFWVAVSAYKSLLGAGVCPEQARMVLPQSMYTEWYWSGTLGAFLDMLKLRLKSDTQKETRVIAELISEIVKEHWPVSYEAVLG